MTIDRQAARVPDAIAVVCGDEHVTYREVVRRAKRLARRLREVGVAVDTPVGVCGEASIATVVGVLGTLNAGGAYVVIPPEATRQRLSELAASAGFTCVVGGRADLRTGAGAVPIWIDPGAPLDASRGDRHHRAARLDSLAFVRFTSGSTGRPKGVMNTHRSIMSRLSAGPLPDMQPDEVCAVDLSLGFGSRLFYPLALGATAVIVRPEIMQDPTALGREVARMRITSLYLVPSPLRALLSGGDDGVVQLRSLRALTLGGEPVTEDIVRACRTALPGVALIVLYGSSEIGTAATIKELDRQQADEWQTLGRSVAHTAVHLLDETMTEVGVGEAGEIYVGSDHLARGYLRAPGQTAERFLPDPFATRRGSRLYRTGDLARRRNDASIEFIGRVDRQVKIRGHRVELEAIEAVLRAHPGIRDAAVVARASVPAARGSDAASSLRVIAYVVAAAAGTCRVSALRAYVAARLAAAAVPALFIVVARLPLLPAGKIDLRALPVPGPDRPELDTPYVPARSGIEARLADLWASVLGIDPIGVDDDFLELGGDSLSAGVVLRRVEREFHVSLTLAAMFENPTVAALARVVEAGTGAARHSRPELPPSPSPLGI